MSKHREEKSPELRQALLNHGLPDDKPSQLADSFCNGWQAAQAVQPSQAVELSDRHISELKATSIMLRKSDGPVTFSAKKLQIADAIDTIIVAIKGVP